MPFTLKQIEEAHSKVQTGADFPQYMKDLIALGVLNYRVYVNDGHSEYIGNDNHVVSEAEYPALAINSELDIDNFKYCLSIHQQGETDYFTFCKHAAESGIHSWTIDTAAKTCTYYNAQGEAVVTENIPV